MGRLDEKGRTGIIIDSGAAFFGSIACGQQCLRHCSAGGNGRSERRMAPVGHLR